MYEHQTFKRFLGMDMILLIAGISSFIANNVNIENWLQRIIALILGIAFICLTKFILLNIYPKGNYLILFLTSLVELGIFLNLYIRGFNADSGISRIADYWFSITAFVPVTCWIFLPNIFFKKLKTSEFKWWFPILVLLMLSLIWIAGLPLGRANIGKASLEILFICIFIIFFDQESEIPVQFLNAKLQNLKLSLKQNPVFSYLLLLIFTSILIFAACIFRGQTSTRNAILEVLKVIILVLFALFFHHRLVNRKDRTDRIFLDMITLIVMTVLIAGIIGGLANEFGTALILLLFLFLFILYISCTLDANAKAKYKMGYGISILLMAPSVTAYCLVYRIWKYKGLTGNEPLIQKLSSRLFELSDNEQIAQMQTALNESPGLFVAMPYSITLTGREATRVEDFSFMNVTTIFGSAVAILLIIIMFLIPMKLLSELRSSDQWEQKYSFHNLFCIGSCILFISNTFIHILSNYGLFLFTGVTLPLISNGFMNMTVFYLIFNEVLKQLNQKE